MAFLY